MSQVDGKIQLSPYILSSGKIITGTLVWYFFVCKREVWFMGHEITPDQDFVSLEIGRVFHEIFYENIKKEISLNGIRLDFFKRKKKIVCEVKTSSKFLEATKFQVIYYLYRLKEYDIEATGEILIPKERERIKVYLNDENERKLLNALKEINKIVEAEKPPPPIRNSYCRKCAYKEFCWV